jgi:antagonist of KipI
MTSVRVEKAGLLSTVQDAGRRGGAHLGISASGAADGLALRIGNLLVGNEENAAAIEMTLVGGRFVFDADTEIAVTGADMACACAGAPVRPWEAILVGAGEVLEFGASREGARGYLCVRGGIDVPMILGSASTHLLTGLGGHEGRALRAGDVLSIGTPKGEAPSVPAGAPRAAAEEARAGRPRPADAPEGAPLEAARSVGVRIDAGWIRALYAERPIRITPGPQSDWFSPETTTWLVSSPYTVLEQSNRMGIRLSGHALERPVGSELLTEGVSLGAIQVPDSGLPIILFVEHQTTGGYPKIANVCSVDMHRVGQLRPRDTVRFELVTFETADRLYRERRDAIDRLSGRGQFTHGAPSGSGPQGASQ